MNKKRKTDAIDRISKLPDDLIAKIISFLTLKQAAATSVISTRWREMWKLYSGFFDFDGSEIARDLMKLSRKRFALAFFTKWKNFVYHVDWVLRSHQGAEMKRLRINFDVIKLSHKIIDGWVQLALAKRVQFIELDLSDPHPHPPYAFPIYSHCGFESLKTLILKHVEISGDALQSLVDNCPNLEELTVTDAGTLKVLRLSSLSLKYVTLLSCGGHFSPMDMKISAPNLLSLTWTGRKESKLVLEDVPKLNCVNLQGYWYHIRTHHSQLVELVLSLTGFGSDGCENRGNTNIPELSNLKHLTMRHFTLDDNTFCLLVAYIKAAPLLENLTFEMLYAGWEAKLSEAVLKVTNNHCYKNLKSVKFIGFMATNESSHVEFIDYIVNRALLLETIIIDVCPGFYLGKPEEIEYRQTAAYLEARDLAVNFGADLPCHVTVV